MHTVSRRGPTHLLHHAWPPIATARLLDPLRAFHRATPGADRPRLVKNVCQRRRLDPNIRVATDPFGREGQNIAVEVAHERADRHFQRVGVATLFHEDHEHGTQEARTARVEAVSFLSVPCPGCQQVDFLQQGVEPAIRQVLG